MVSSETMKVAAARLQARLLSPKAEPKEKDENAHGWLRGNFFFWRAVTAVASVKLNHSSV